MAPTMMHPVVLRVDGCDVEVRSGGPFYARPAKDGDDSWPFWYVAGPDGRRNVCGFGRGAVLCSREFAESVAKVANAAKL